MNKEKQREAISAAITAIHEGPNVPQEVKTTFTDVMKGLLNVILYPITSTQLGVFNNFLDMTKLDVLEAVDERAKIFKEKFLNLFVQENPKHKKIKKTVQEIDEAKKLRRTAVKNFDSLFKEPKMDLDAWAKNWRDFEQLPKMRQKRYELRELFIKELKNAGFTELSTNILHQVIRNNPRLVAGTTHTFNLLGAVGATYSIFREIFTPDSAVRQGSPRDVASVVATFLGGIGSVKGTYDLAKVLKEKIFPSTDTRRPTDTGYTEGVRSAEELVTFEDELTTEFGVDLSNMERYVERKSRLDKVSKLGKVFTVLGVFADTIFFGLSVYDLYNDFNTDSKDPWKIADDFLFAASSGVGAAFGKCYNWFISAYDVYS